MVHSFLPMRRLYFLVPGTTEKFRCGGLFAELKTLDIAKQLCDATVVTYRQREADVPFLSEVLQQPDAQQAIFVVSWGFDVPKLVKQLCNHHVVYHAHSAGYGFQLPKGIPIVTVSRNTLGYWGQYSPSSLIYYLPNNISDTFHNTQQLRDIDVLVHARKSSTYLLKQLVPALEQVCNVSVITTFVDDLSQLFNRTTVYLYDSAEYWSDCGVTEGFGLQPLEAMACGCQVFSSVNHGLSDYLDPGFNCYKIAGYAKDYDIKRILQAIASPTPRLVDEAILAEYRTESIKQRFQVILQELNQFFDFVEASTDSQGIYYPLSTNPLQRLWKKVLKKLKA